MLLGATDEGRSETVNCPTEVGNFNLFLVLGTDVNAAAEATHGSAIGGIRGQDRVGNPTLVGPAGEAEFWAFVYFGSSLIPNRGPLPVSFRGDRVTVPPDPKRMPVA